MPKPPLSNSGLEERLYAKASYSSISCRFEFGKNAVFGCTVCVFSSVPSLVALLKTHRQC